MTPVDRKPMTLDFAFFNQKEEDAERARQGFIHRFGQQAFIDKIQPILDQGCMTVFKNKPTPETLWYVEIVSFLVNERYMNAE